MKTFQLIAAAMIAAMSSIGSAEAASKVQFGDCSHPEPRAGSSFSFQSGGNVQVIGRLNDIVEFRYDGRCIRDYIRDGQGLDHNDIRLATTPDGVRTVLVRMGNNRDLIRVYAILPDGTIFGAFDRIQDGTHLRTQTNGDGSFHVTYGRKKDLAGSYWFDLNTRTWQFGRASRNRNWTINF